MTGHAQRILVVEDEPHLADGIRENLLAEGYLVDVAEDGEAALARWQKGDIHMLILDVMLPRLDGFAVCKAIREKGGRTPVLFLTARNTSDDRVRGLEVGGDDYLGKPFVLKELLMRVQAMLRRQNWYVSPTGHNDLVTIAGNRINFRTYEVTDPEGTVSLLPQKEVMILKLLLEKSPQVVSRDEILDQVWGYDVYPSSRTVDNFIVRLRKRFEPDPANPQFFHTVRGVGYRATVPQEPANGSAT